MFRLNPGSTRGASHHAAFMFNWPTIIHTICQCQSKILSCCLCVWCKSREIGGRVSARFTNGGELLRRPYSYRKLMGRVAFRISSNINDGVLCESLWCAFR